MPTRNVNLTHAQDRFVEDIVRAGEYQNASEAVRDALRMLQQRHQEDALKQQALRTLIAAGTDSLDRGDFVEREESEILSYLHALAPPSGKTTP